MKQRERRRLRRLAAEDYALLQHVLVTIGAAVVVAGLLVWCVT